MDDVLLSTPQAIQQRASDTVELFLHTAQELRSLLSIHFAEFGLTEIRFAALHTISNAVDAECTQSHLAERLHQTESSISTLVERMRNDGLLFRMTSKEDRRKRVLLLSEKGQQMLQAVRQCHNERLQRLLRSLNPLQQKELQGLLESLAEDVGQMNREYMQDLKTPWSPPSQRAAA